MSDLNYGYEVTIQTPASFDPTGSPVENQWQRKTSGNTNWENITDSTDESYTVAAEDRNAKIRLRQSLNGAKTFSNDLQVTDTEAAPPSGEGFGGFITCEIIGDGNYGGVPGDGMNDSGVKYLLILSPVIGGVPQGDTNQFIKWGRADDAWIPIESIGRNQSYGGITEQYYGNEFTEYPAVSWVNGPGGSNTDSLSGYTDWYLPAWKELQCIWSWAGQVPNEYRILKSTSTWSCSETSGRSSVDSYFAAGNYDNRRKRYTGQVRAVRRQRIF